MDCLFYYDASTNNQKWFITIFGNKFQKKPTKPWITGFSKRNHLSTRLPQSKSSTFWSPGAFDAGVEFLKQVQALNKDPKDIVAIDKTGVYTNVTEIMHLAPKGAGRIQKTGMDRGEKDIVFSGLVANGTHKSQCFMLQKTKKFLKTLYTVIQK